MAKKHKHWAHQEYHLHPFMTLFIAVIVLLTSALVAFAQGESGDKGFDEYGYNYKARVFQGIADGIDRIHNNGIWGDQAYAQDHLVMKWSKAWKEARFDGEAWSCDAWTNNEWNGKKSGGSDENWIYKIVWVGPELEDSDCWRAGGYPIWGEFEVIMSHGTVANEHFWDAHAIPSGYGMMTKPF